MIEGLVKKLIEEFPNFAFNQKILQMKKELADVSFFCEVIVREDDSKVTREIVFTRDAALVDSRRRGCCVKKTANSLAYQHMSIVSWRKPAVACLEHIRTTCTFFPSRLPSVLLFFTLRFPLFRPVRAVAEVAGRH